MTARLALVAAIDANFGVGLNGRIPWSLPSDLRWFRELTLGGSVCYGRITQKLLSGGMLKDRKNYMLTRNPKVAAVTAMIRDTICVPSVEWALKLHEREHNMSPLFVIGGHRAWAEAFDLATAGCPTLVYLTCVQGDYGCDVKFPMRHLGWTRLQLGPTQPGPPPSVRQLWSNF